MKLTKKLEAEILKAYNEYWDAYLKGDMQTMSYWLHDNVQMIGSGRSEFFKNKKETVKYYRSTSAQVAGKADMRNRKISVIPTGDQILVNEECDFFVLVDSVWTFYEQGRISTLFTKTNKGWKIIQEHGSMPDARTSEGEQVNTDKIKAENIRLKDAVKRRTIELEEKNRELEIETSLEKVRARTMAMQKSNELPETTFLLFQQLKELGETAAQLSIGIVKEEEGFVELSATVHGNTMPLTYLIPADEPFMMKKAVKAWKAKKRSLIIELKGKELKDYNKWRNSVLKKKIIFPEKQWIVNVVFFSKGLLSFSSDKEISKETFQLLKRFAAVFDLTYTRFLDLKKAEAQAREAEIELALERVRAKTMAMQKSEELKETTLVLFQQFKSLGATTAQVSICVFDEDVKTGEMFVTLKGEKIDRSFIMELDKEIFVMKKAKKAFLENKKNFSQTVRGKELQNYNHWRNILIGKKGWDESAAVRKHSWYVNAVFFSRGMMGISSDIKPSDEVIKLLERFANVFDLTFTRFLDLQKAEAQARGAEIELALERVRAKTMAMQKPSEFVNVINVIGEQFINLGFDIEWVNFGANGLDISKGIDIWNFVVIPGLYQAAERVLIPYIDHPVFTDGLRELENYRNTGKDFFVTILNKKQKDKWLDHLFSKTIFKDSPAELKNVQYPKPGYITSNIALKDTWLSIGKFDIKTFTDEQNVILRKFGNAFGQAYTRFLDLQKAEAQAREAQIETALEKVRSRTMAMQKSYELNEVIQLVYDQFVQLKINVEHTGFIIDYKERDDLHIWLADRHLVPSEVFVPYFDCPPNNSIKEAKEKGKDFFEYLLDFEEKNKFYRDLFKLVLDVPEETLKYYLTCPGLAGSGVLLENIGLYIENFSGTPYSDEENKILMRFGKVFQQTYTRFLDLQKAEAQTREAHIEASLERVRAKTMAMHKSADMLEVVKTLGEQFELLGFKFNSVNFNTDIHEKDWNLWLYNVGSAMYPGKIHVPYIDHPCFNRPMEAFKKGGDFHSFIFTKEEKDSFFDHIYTNTVAKHGADERKRLTYAAPGFAMSTAVTKNTRITISNFSGEPFSEDENAILRRFANVFEQSYTRFLDLQKAEAQARESQVQLALERVRARTMAMQKSDELSEAVYILFQQFRELGENPDQATIGIINEKDWIIEYWVTMYGNQMDKVFKFSIDEPNVTNRIYKAWKEEKKSLVIDLSGKELYEFTHYRESKGGAKYNPQEKRRIFNIAFFSKGLLIVQSNELRSEESIHLLERFATVFEQTYTRFLDLKQAEEQARESQIQLALERVRARTMAMQKSDELGEAASLLFKQINDLGIQTWTSGFNIWQRDNNSFIGYNPTPSGGITAPYIIPAKEDPFFITISQAKEAGEDFIVYEWKDKLLAETYRYMKTLPIVKEVLKGIEDSGFQLPTFQINHCAFFAQGFLLFITLEPYPEAHDIFRRFAKVFEQTYTRFLDLQKAEEQAREAQIEAALERVRSRTMAMHQTSELQEVIHTVHKELLNLNLSIYGGSFVVINDDVGPALRCWGSGGTANTSEEVTVPDFNMPFCTNLVKGIKSGPGFFTEEFSQEEKKKYFNKLFEQKPWSDLASEEKEKTISSAGGYTRSVAVSKHTTIFIINHNGRKFTEDENDILKRFAKVFEQTYTRFLDLKKAEEQAREATIEASLERVRARAMAMHKTNELLEAGQLLYKELTGLGIKSLSVTYSIMAEDEKSAFYYGINPVDGKVGENPMVFPHTETEVMREILLAWKKQKSIHSIELDEAATLKHQTYVGEHILAGIEKYKLNIPFSVEAFLEVSPKKAFINTFNFKQGYLFIIGDAPLSSEQQQILLRFTKVFELTYRRFLDLQQAEAQAREAQIEAGLERVRSRGMAMQTSEELAQLIGTLFTELTKLDLVLTRCVIWIIDPKTNDAVWWMANSEDPSRPMNYSIPYHEEPPWLAFINEWKKRTLKWVYDLKGQIKKDWDDHLFSKTGLVKMPGFIRDAMKAPERVLLSASFNNFGGMNVASLEPLSDEHFTILLRFAKVFDLTYTRFNDLKQAEAQAREATIEAALERVRGKAMAMHTSADISTTASTIFSEIQKLGITSSRCGVGLLSKNNRYARMYAATVSGENNSLALIGEVELAGHSCYDNQYEAFLKGTDYFGVLEKDELRSYYEAFRKKFPGLPTDVNKYEREYCYYLSFTEGILYSWSEKPYSENQVNILNRFRSIIDLTFRRYIELQKSEANAKEAVKQAALDRIRADIASMRTVSDLERITPLIWNELTTLNVPFIRCGVFIMDESQQFIRTFLSTPDGKAIAAFHIPYDTPGNIAQVLSHWREKNTYISHWGEVDFTGIADILVKQGAVASKEQYLNTLPKEGFHLHFLPFLQGMLYVGNTNELDVEQIELLQHVAGAFSTAYARYEDFNKLEAAKKQVDSTLNELQATQKQLIQSEKMASLGELTAGIAHEIQNPLNFVNNFSEVSNELIEEMNIEIEKGDIEEAKAIANDIKQNLEKINHHGKRADAIVKGMLQHSRSSTGQKELTDINALADEYLRLSYHGLRAKDKTFNAKFETVCDSTIGKINIVPQDIGRVILNLINNAFYAVAEKKKQNTNGYEPSVTVSTKKIGDKIELRVTDNGNGIPPKVLDKIFQPFFTTKPTGQGTGLGLSLSYDIITKGHGGELKVETREGEGSEFIIHLPVV